MGILSKIFGRKEEEADFQQIDQELEKLRQKENAEMVVICGLSGRLKGLPLIYSAEDEKELKRFTARLNEIITPLNNISNNRTIRDFILNYHDSVLFYKPVMENIGFFALLEERSNILPVKQWIYKKEDVLKNLLHD